MWFGRVPREDGGGRPGRGGFPEGHVGDGDDQDFVLEALKGEVEVKVGRP